MDLIHYTKKLQKIEPILNADFSCSYGQSYASTNDFELKTFNNGNLFEIGDYILYGNTEFGGKIREREIDVVKNKVTYRGYTLRGMLNQFFVGYGSSSGFIPNQTPSEIVYMLIYLWAYLRDNWNVLPAISNETDITVEIVKPQTSLETIEQTLDIVDQKMKIYINNGQVYVQLMSTDKLSKIDISREKIIFSEDTYSPNRIIGRGKLKSDENTLQVVRYLQPDGSISDVPYYENDETVLMMQDFENVNDESHLIALSDSALLMMQRPLTSEVLLTSGNGEVGDYILHYIPEIKKTVQQRIVEKTIKIKNGETTIKSYTGG